MRLNLWQRLGLAALLVLMFAGFGKNVAASIVAARGDEFSSRSGLVYSLQYYERALDLDPANSAASLGLLRTLFLIHTPKSLQSGIGVADRFLALHTSHDSAFYGAIEKRAYMELLTGAYAPAATDFERIAVDRKSGEDADLAFRSAQRLGDHAAMRRYVDMIARYDPRQMPSPAELRSLNL